MVKGGIMLFDDYGILSCRGVKMTADEFFANKPKVPVYLTTGQCLYHPENKFRVLSI